MMGLNTKAEDNHITTSVLQLVTTQLSAIEVIVYCKLFRIPIHNEPHERTCITSLALPNMQMYCNAIY